MLRITKNKNLGNVLALLTLTLITTSTTYGTASVAIPDRRQFPINPLVSPCQDFYQHTCSLVNESFKLRDDRSSHTFAFNDSAERLLLKKQQFFLGLAKEKPQSEHELALKNFYTACMNGHERKKAEINEVLRISNILQDKKMTREDFLSLVEKSYLNADSSPLDWGAISNLDQSENNDLYLISDYLTLPEKTYYKKAEVVADLQSLLITFFKTIKVKNPTVLAQAVVDFEKDLAEVTPEPSQFRQIINNRNPITRKELLEKFKNLRLNGLLTQVPENVIIRNWVPEALTYLDKYLGDAPLENLRALYAYNSLKEVMDEAYPVYFKQKFEFSRKHFGGPEKRPDKQERCTRKAMGVFTKEIDAILMPRIFPNFPREKFVNLAEKIRSSIVESLEENQWLTKEAKTEAIKKMKTAKLHLVSPSTEKEWDFLPKATYSSKDSVENSKIITKVYKDKSLKDLREPTDKGRWDMGPLTVNAYYDPSFNKFVMPIGILQYPFYDPNQSEVQNIGAIGTIIGHELGHGVDDQGARYDFEGRQRQWMGIKDLKNFSDRAAGMIAQFDKIGHNGKLTQGENIGDLVGLSAAYRTAAKEPGFLDKPEIQQEFFRSYGRAWCTVSRPKFDETKLKTDPHALGYARVNEQVKHQPGFAKAFQCKETDPMVLPKDKQVRIW